MPQVKLTEVSHNHLFIEKKGTTFPVSLNMAPNLTLKFNRHCTMTLTLTGGME